MSDVKFCYVNKKLKINLINLIRFCFDKFLVTGTKVYCV